MPERLGDYRDPPRDRPGRDGRRLRGRAGGLGRHVALKVLPQHGPAGPVQLIRFQREARAAALLHHTNIVPVFGVGEHDGVHYYAMQFIQGQGLDAVLRESPAASAEWRSVDGAELAVDAEPRAGHARPRWLSGLLADRSAATRALAGDDPAAPSDERAPPEPAGLRPTGRPGAVRRRTGPRRPSSIIGRPSRTTTASVARLGVQVAEALALCPRPRGPPPRHQAGQPAARPRRARSG